MTLYLYKTGTNIPIKTIENVVSYTDNEVRTEEGYLYSPFADDAELSSIPDCSETLRADWRRDHPSQLDRLDDLEALVAALLFGGESV